MKEINELLKLGFNLQVDNNNIKLDYKGGSAPDISKVKPLIEQLKQNKDKAIQYIQSLIIYEIPEGINFDYQVQACLQSAHENDIEWLRTDVCRKSNKVVLVGALKKPELIAKWKDVSRDGEFYQDCPWVS